MKTGGYTLLEMLVVIGLLALTTALVAPAGQRLARSWQDAQATEQVLRDIARLPTLTRQSGRALELAAGEYRGESPLLPLPESWRMQFETPLVIGANGACSGGRALLETETASIPLEITGPYCRVFRLDLDS